jgi:hypothetical protein
MKLKFGKVLIAMVTVLGIGLGTLTLAAPASAAAPTGAVEISAPAAANLPANAVLVEVPANTTRAELPGLLRESGIDWNNIWHWYTSLVTCEYWAAVYAARYFPAITECVWYNNAWALIVILIR